MVQTEGKAKDIVSNSIKDGWEPHFVVAYGDIVEEIQTLGNMLNIPIVKY